MWHHRTNKGGPQVGHRWATCNLLILRAVIRMWHTWHTWLTYIRAESSSWWGGGREVGRGGVTSKGKREVGHVCHLPKDPAKSLIGKDL
jgi:hypothetical protein